MEDEKSEAKAIIFSIIPGAGQMYCGRIGRGLAILLITTITLLIYVGAIIYIWQFYDAYKCAREYNQTHQWRCPRCGNNVPKGAVACPTCGQPLMAAVPGAYGEPVFGQQGYVAPPPALSYVGYAQPAGAYQPGADQPPSAPPGSEGPLLPSERKPPPP